MTSQILATKIAIPSLGSALVPRFRLVDQLAGAVDARLILVSAPAGSGKTTLASQWAGACGHPVTWLTLDEHESDVVRFLTYLIASLQHLAQNLGEGILGALQSSHPPSVESVLTALINAISTIQEHVFVVLDDYHTIDSTAVDNALEFLLQNLPPQMHIFIVTREDPQLPLARLRVRGELIELRASDLRFNVLETTTFLDDLMGLDLNPGEIGALEARTEGWIAGLQLAALSMRGRSDISGFVRDFTGSHRFVMDYLVEEVLRRQAEPVREFLLQTSILDRLTGSLCDAVTGQMDSANTLEMLEGANLFVIRLDDQRQWYRYHHLFADVLQARLTVQFPKQAVAAYSSASTWYELNGNMAEAIRCAISAGEYERAVRLAEAAWPHMSGSFQSIAWLDAMRSLPDEFVRELPVLCLGFAWAFLNAGNLEAANQRLADAERILERDNWQDGMQTAGQTVVADQELLESIRVSLATARAYHAQATGDLDATVKYARSVLDVVPDGASRWRDDATALLSLSYWTRGDLGKAHQTFSDGISGMGPLEVIVGTFVLVDINMALGRVPEAFGACERALQFASQHGEPIGTEDVYTALGLLRHERGDLDAAAEALETSRRIGQSVQLPDWQYRWSIAKTCLLESQGDLEAALDHIERAERQYVRTPLPQVRPIPALKARLWIKQGRLREAADWARAKGLSAGDEPSYLREFEHLTLARLLLEKHDTGRTDGALQQALVLLQKLLKAAVAGGRMRSEIEILILMALARQKKGDKVAALDLLNRSLERAHSPGYVSVFANEGSPMAELLRHATDIPALGEYVATLRAACGDDESGAMSSSGAVEALSKRELEVLHLLQSELSGPEMADHLFVSLNTLRTHTKRIYSKLGTSGRRATVKRAEELGLI